LSEHEINTNSAVSQTTVSLKRVLRRETRLIRGIIAEMIKEI